MRITFRELGQSELLANRGWAIALAVLGGLLQPSPSQAVCKREAVDLPVTISGTRPTVPAKINGIDVRFIIDSGAFYSMITPAAAAELNLRVSMGPRLLRVSGIGGDTVPSLTTVKVFALNNITMPNVEFLVAGSSAGAGVVGVIGQNMLQKSDVEYNLAQGMIRLMRDKDCSNAMLAYWVKPDDPVSLIDMRNVEPGNPHTTSFAYVNDVKIRIAFDTGAAESMLSRRAAEHAGLKIDAPEVTDGGMVSGIGTAVAKSYIVPVASFKFADGEEIKNTRLRVAEVDLQTIDMLLGADFFLSHRIFVANSQSKIYFTYNGGPVFNLAKTAASSSRATQSAAASAAAQQSAVDEPVDAAASARRGMAFAGRRDYDRALADLSRACELDPNNPEYFFERGNLYLQKHAPADALKDFDRALLLKPDHVPSLINRAALRMAADQTAEARADLDAIDKFAANQADVRLDMAMILERAAEMPAAIAQLDLWIAAHGDDARMPIALARRCKARAVLGRDLDQATKDCNRAVSTSHKGANPRITETRAFLRLRLADYDKAIEDYDAVLKMDPQSALALYGRGFAKSKTIRIAAGEEDMVKAKAMSPGIAGEFEPLGMGH